MNEIHLTKNGYTVSCATDSDRAAWCAIEDGKGIAITVRCPRNPKHHALTRALLDRLADNWPGGDVTDEQVLLWLKFRTGLVKVVTVDGEDHVIPLSTSFDSMSQSEYETWWRLALSMAAGKLGCSILELEQNLCAI